MRVASEVSRLSKDFWTTAFMVGVVVNQTYDRLLCEVACRGGRGWLGLGFRMVKLVSHAQHQRNSGNLPPFQ